MGLAVSFEILATEGLVSFEAEIERIREYHDLAPQFPVEASRRACRGRPPRGAASWVAY